MTRGFFEASRVFCAFGFALNEDDFVVGKDRVLILSDALWRGAFGADPGALGRGIQMDGNLYTIVGVMPSSFHFGGERTLYWTPFVFDSSLATARGAHFLHVLARVRDGVSLASAQSEMKQIAAQLERQYPNYDKDWIRLSEFR